MGSLSCSVHADNDNDNNDHDDNGMVTQISRFASRLVGGARGLKTRVLALSSFFQGLGEGTEENPLQSSQNMW